MAQIDNKRIAKNTMMLYVRTTIVTIISLFTSRITLQVLGVDNYGVNSAVAGVVAMFSVISGALSGAISRFITFELGRGGAEKLHRIFCTSVHVQVAIGILVLILGETLGVWFLNTRMSIPEGRMVAANWVLQCAVFSFVIGLTQIPYTACIVGHERMSVFAVFSVVDAVLRLVIVCLLFIAPYDKLISYAVLGFTVTLLIRILQRVYCVRHFAECHYALVFDRGLLKEMTSFAGWSFLSHSAWIFSTQGVSILINLFFGVTFNAARGIANTLEGAIKKFCNDFMTSMSPQITKSYAAGELQEMNQLIGRGTRFSYYLLFAFSLPLLFETEFVLRLWLGNVPEHAVSFFRLTTLSTLVTVVGQTSLKGILATGTIKRYTIAASLVAVLVLPLTWLAYRMGAPAETTYFFFIGIYALLDVLRILFMKRLWGFPIGQFFREAILPILLVTIAAALLPATLYFLLHKGWLKSVLVIIISIISVCAAAYGLGMQAGERKVINNRFKKLYLQVVAHQRILGL